MLVEYVVCDECGRTVCINQTESEAKEKALVYQRQSNKLVYIFKKELIDIIGGINC